MPRQASPPPERPPTSKISPPTTAKATPPSVNELAIDRTSTDNDIYQHSNYVYILDPEYSWIPAQVTNRTKADTSGTTANSKDEQPQILHLSVPQYKSEQAIQCDGGRTAKSFKKIEINLGDPKTLAKYPSKHLPLQNVNSDGEIEVVEDMVDLPFLHEAAILYNLKSRHVKSLPYTRTGDIILACNPYQWFHDLYTEQVRNHYSHALVWNAASISNSNSSNTRNTRRSQQLSSPDNTPSKTSRTSSDPRTTLSPHVYETSCMAYKGLLRDEEDQSILVSGESGAGKTETVKILLRNLADIQEGGGLHKTIPKSNSSPDVSHDNIIVQRVLDSNPLLEAFGNATTLRNDNSSRFGKYLQLQFDTTLSSSTTDAPAILAGSKCEVYLLEKSRVTHHHVSERTYHIFYQLLAAPEELKVAIWDGLADTDVESFCYVGLTESSSLSATQGIIEGKTDAERFQLTLQALELIGVQGKILQMLLRAICVVLQLGNLEFSPAQPSDASSMMALGIHARPGGSGGDGGDHDACVISSVEELQELSELMGMNDIDDSGGEKISKALQKALTVRNVEARGEVFAVPLTPLKAKESADAFAKEIYAKTFLWLVRTINDATCAEKNYQRKASNLKSSKSITLSPSNYGIIGLLDIFGFETFEVNRFEQLCINYCNEKLQQKFTQDIFRSVQVEYENEGIELEEITYDDNTDVLDLVEGRLGLLAFLNEECVRPKGSDKTFVYKAQAMNKENPCFFRDKHAQDTEFGICHYAGKVVYDATNFVVKNTDTLATDLLECAKISSNSIIAKELTNEDMMNLLHVNSVSSDKAKKKKRPKSTQSLSSSHPSLQKRTSNIVAETVWTKFKNQLSRLMDTLSETKTRYIRCIKPNSQKAPLLMEHISTVEQLRCAGVVAAVTISRSAFPNRLDHLSVLDRFKSLWPKGDHIAVLQDHDLDPEVRRKKGTEILLTLALKDMEFEKNGSSFRAFVMGKTRAYFRAGALEFLEAERLKHLGTYATVLQAAIRGFVLRSKYKRHRRAVIILQAHYLQIQQKRRYTQMKQAAIRIECWNRVILSVRAVYHLRRTIRATSIQTRWRIHRDRRRLKSAVLATIKMQAVLRGSLQRPKYRQALIDKKEEAKLENQLRTLQKKLEEAETKRLDAEKQSEERAKAAVEHYKKKESPATETKTCDDEPGPTETADNEASQEDATAGPSVQELTAEQQRLMDESGKMLESLRKEVFKLRSQNQQLKTDFELLKDNNQRLMDANASAGASFAALNQHAKLLSKQNAKLVSETQNLKGQVHKLNIQQVELRDELKFKTATYVAEVQSRLNFQKALQKITDIIQESCRDHRLVERVLSVADEVEMDLMPGLEDDGHEQLSEDEIANARKASRGGILGYFFP